MASKEVKKFALILDYSKGKYGIAFEHSEKWPDLNKPEPVVSTSTS